jgi:K+-sensing histidine kinase KdpD
VAIRAWRAAGSRFRQSAVSTLLASIGVALVTAICYRLHANFAIASLIYLLVIILQSLAGDFLYSLVVSFVAVACLDYFFVDPLYSLAIVRGVDTIALLSFLTTALVITTLVSRLRAETESAHRFLNSF